jgi:hypothetical protein
VFLECIPPRGGFDRLNHRSSCLAAMWCRQAGELKVKFAVGAMMLLPQKWAFVAVFTPSANITNAPFVWHCTLILEVIVIYH